MSHDEHGCINCGVPTEETIAMAKKMKAAFGEDRSADATTVCSYCGQAEGHTKRCSVTKFNAPEDRTDKATFVHAEWCCAEDARTRGQCPIFGCMRQRTSEAISRPSPYDSWTREEWESAARGGLSRREEEYLIQRATAPADSDLYANLLREHDAWARIARDRQAENEMLLSSIEQYTAERDAQRSAEAIPQRLCAVCDAAISRPDRICAECERTGLHGRNHPARVATDVEDEWDLQDVPFVDIVHSCPPGPDSSFVEAEREDGRGVKIGQWIERQDGTWALRIYRHNFGAAVPPIGEYHAIGNPPTEALGLVREAYRRIMKQPGAPNLVEAARLAARKVRSWAQGGLPIDAVALGWILDPLDAAIEATGTDEPRRERATPVDEASAVRRGRNQELAAVVAYLKRRAEWLRQECLRGGQCEVEQQQALWLAEALAVGRHLVDAPSPSSCPAPTNEDKESGR